MRANRLVWVLAAVVLLAGALPVLAQRQLGAITGSVLDPQGAVIPGAKVTVRDQNTNSTYTAGTDDKGAFTVPALPYGVYVVTVEAGGFRRWESTDVRVITAETTIIRAVLEIGAITETVTVESAGEVVNTVSPELQHNVQKKQIIDLPVSSRAPIDFVSLQPGFQQATTIRTGRIHGLRGSTNNITLDGINAQDNFIRTDGQFSPVQPSVDQVGEVSISTGTVGSDSGAGVSQIRLSTPRGSNEFHGSAYYFHRNDAFNANSWENNFFGTPKDRLRQHTFGGTFGGPVWIPKVYNGKDRTFGFFSYEGFRENFAQARTRTVLDQDARTGIFSYRRVDNGQVQNVNLITLSSNTFPINPFTLSLINATPLPDGKGGAGDGLNTSGFTFAVKGKDPDDNYRYRVDHKLFESKTYGTHWLEFVFHLDKFLLAPDTFNAIDAAFPAGVATSCVDGVCQGGLQNPERRLLALAMTSQFGTNKFNEVRGGFQRSLARFSRDGVNPRPFNITFQNNITNPEQNFLKQGRLPPFYTFLDNFSWVKGSHSLKMGFDYYSLQVIAYNDAGTIPTFTLNTNSAQNVGFLNNTTNFPGGIAAADFTRAQQLYINLVGLMGSATQTFNLASPDSGFVSGQTRLDYIRERSYQGYFMDTWRTLPSFTLTYGMRYEYVTPADVVNGVTAMPIGNEVGFFTPYDKDTPIFQPDGSVTFGQVLSGAAPRTQLANIGRNRLWDPDRNNFAPFLGFAYSPDSDNMFLKTLFGKAGKGAMRGGFSTSYARDGLTVATSSRVNNTGAQQALSLTTLTGVLNSTGSGVVFTPPAFSEPIDQLNNFRLAGAPTNIFTYDRNLRVPYVLQWSLGIEREILPQTRLEIRYVGNHALKLYRGFDLNQPSVLNNGMLAEFNAARTNLACNTNATFGTVTNSWANLGRTCSVPLPIMAMLGPNTDPALASQFTNATRINELNRQEAGEWTHQLASFYTLNYFGLSASSLAACRNTPGTCVAGLGNLPFNFFRTNPLVLNGIVLGNNANSNYHGLEIELYRRFSRGFLLQGNYTFAKAITDADGASQNEFFPHLSITDPRRERTRATFDIQHTFNMNTIWELPVGRGRRYISGGVFGKILEGWQAGGIWRWYSGRPQNIFSARGTLNRIANSTTNEATFLGGLNAQKVCDDAGIYKTPQGIFWLPTEYLRNPGNGTTTGASTALFGHPTAGNLGDVSNRLKCEGPGLFRIDMNFVKRTYITEKINFEFRAEFFNIFNHPNFRTSSQNFTIDGTGFGRLTSVDTPREIQFNARLNF